MQRDCERHKKPFYRRSNLRDHYGNKHPGEDIPANVMGDDFLLLQMRSRANLGRSDSLVEDERRLRDLEARKKALTDQVRALERDISKIAQN